MRWFLLAGLAACSGGGGGKTDDSSTGDTGTGLDTSFFINVTTPPTGDLTCYSGTWLPKPTLCDGCTDNVTLNGTVQDFQEETPVAQADVELYFGDSISGEVSVSTKADANGAFTASVPACTPLGYKTSTPVQWDQTKDTYEVHQIWEHDASGTISETVNSVSVATAKIIPAMLGQDWDSANTGIIAGTAFDCNEDPIDNAQVVVKSKDGVVQNANIYYFKDSFPNQTELDTSPDGLWVAVNVPAGTWNVEMYVWDEAAKTQKLIGSTSLEVKANSVNISNIYTGHDDGIAYPPSCIAQ